MDKKEITFLPTVRRCAEPAKSTLLQREHDTNDTIKERLAFVEQINAYVKAKEEKAVEGAKKKAFEELVKTSSARFNNFVWSVFLAGAIIIVLKLMKVI